MGKAYSKAVRAANRKYARKYIVARTAGSASFVGVVIIVVVSIAMIAVL